MVGSHPRSISVHRRNGDQMPEAPRTCSDIRGWRIVFVPQKHIWLFVLDTDVTICREFSLSSAVVAFSLRVIRGELLEFCLLFERIRKEACKCRPLKL